MRWRPVIGGVVLGLAVVGLLGVGFAWRALHQPYAGWTGDGVEVQLEAGLDAGSMFERLHAAGVLRRPGMLRGWLTLRGGSGSLHAGEYRFDEPLSALELLERLERGQVMLHAVTLPEGLTAREVAAKVAAAGLASEAALVGAFADPTPVLGLDPTATDLEGYLFPDTYNFPRGMAPEAIAQAMVERFIAVTGPDLPDRAEAIGLTVRQVVTLASMIEKETSVESERGKVSGVFHNRMRKGMKLESDPTTIYALRRAGREVDRLLRRDLSFESPWNTYHARGLPPGPIANPGSRCVEAALMPDRTDALYFVAAPGGGHRFSATYEGHLEAVAEWRRHSRASRSSR